VTGPGRRARMWAFLRSFAIQGSWNHRTMLGGGFSFAVLPLLKRLYRKNPEKFSEALNRHSEHFNAHPYLTNLVLGAVCRMEMDQRDPEEIRRFKLAVRGPLGSVGDSLVWVGWRPATVLAAVCLALAGASPITTVLFFLVLYNLGHLALRFGGFALGLERGSQVGDSLRSMNLSLQADRLASLATFLLGGALGLALNRGWGYGSGPLLWGFLMSLGLFAGSQLGPNSWRWTLWTVSGLIGVFFLFGWLG
jgi:mannose/fructose/N-acetylgalactosamine-specific phosphotransferase system component IID